MPSDITVRLGTAATAEELFEPICQLYDQVFSQPPFRWTDEESQHHRELLASLREDSSFGIVTAQDPGQQLVGFGRFVPEATPPHPLPDEVSTPDKFRVWRHARTSSVIHAYRLVA
jgi:hypothetical protein